eukprot:gnl/TRDRNA2_/TRDRNA2_170668_c2_seq1.p1 gnl/TRDRNA2_/TRDRNA2_170668_c2~~gnl/TRDRNA2_/TRDRNA2_170668_c2_seq1.p1  ORF type:complete len:216 (-),score=8.70 gnl/TRDRNA2_/TRDRNA2_170668_c2_seq1:149-730(-)
MGADGCKTQQYSAKFVCADGLLQYNQYSNSTDCTGEVMQPRPRYSSDGPWKTDRCEKINSITRDNVLEVYYETYTCITRLPIADLSATEVLRVSYDGAGCKEDEITQVEVLKDLNTCPYGMTSCEGTINELCVQGYFGTSSRWMLPSETAGSSESDDNDEGTQTASISLPRVPNLLMTLGVCFLSCPRMLLLG